MYLVFTIPNCPKCNEAKKKLEELNLNYKEIAVMETMENMELAKRYKIRSGGTVVDDETGSIINI